MKIEQCDREAAAALIVNEHFANLLRAGKYDDHPYVEAFAAHRIAERERCAKIAHCHSDDRPRRDSIDWNDGYQDGCRGAAQAIRGDGHDG